MWGCLRYCLVALHITILATTFACHVFTLKRSVCPLAWLENRAQRTDTHSGLLTSHFTLYCFICTHFLVNNSVEKKLQDPFYGQTPSTPYSPQWAISPVYKWHESCCHLLQLKWGYVRESTSTIKDEIWIRSSSKMLPIGLMWPRFKELNMLVTITPSLCPHSNHGYDGYYCCLGSRLSAGVYRIVMRVASL